MKRIYSIALVLLGLTTAKKAHATILLPRIIGHDMVLQANQRVPIWGTADAGELITVRFAGQQKQVTADAAGKWKLMLDPMGASTENRDMRITGSETIVLKNILVGEVWICSGQSNMEYAMRKLVKIKPPANGQPFPKDEVANANNSNLRIFLVNRKTLVKSNPDHRDWSVAEDSALRSFSAAGYFFGKALQQQLKVPVGMISTAVPGSRIEPWIPQQAFTAYDLKQEGDPGKFYEPMVAPLVPFAIKGFLWYQGESNCFLRDTTQYTTKMLALINSWRSAWGNAQLPFYYTQIAPFFYSKTKDAVVLDTCFEAVFREAQALGMKIPSTGMVVTTDLNDDLNDLHPSYKWVIGERLSKWALANTYGKNIVYSGPMFASMKRKGNQIEISFKYTGSGLISHDGKPLNWFSVAGADGKYVAASAFIKGSKVLVSAPGVKNPTAVKFAFHEAAQPNLYNKEGLPALPFRTDGALQWTVPAIPSASL
ncbi:sialate O-acetylesterase [Filimonas effusa]|uniref:Sialate O-acetylesterase n=1 Tax=Filimonas effusa TaxID=2508721 RepID=A0A4Q1DCM7_9BACT|nr:sialate O-acetylesterase [Filimonas effusa]RXK86718.1 sialate O-acetylesterase [Filimonas effusa]